MFLVFCAPVVSHDQAYQTVPVPEHVVNDLAGLSSADPDDELAQYIIDEPAFSPLRDAPVASGVLSMSLRAGQLHMCATYTLAAALTPAQTDALHAYTAAHFSDGAGEGWKQQLWNRNKVPLDIEWQAISLAAP
jgi:hypothetical protein